MSSQQSPLVLSARALVKASLAAVLAAAVALVIVILPAEYGIDPTGAGEWFGLTALSAEAAAPVASGSATPQDKETPAQAADTIDITVPAQSGVEFKFNMDQYQKLTYNWMTDGADLYFDLHGEPEGDTTGYFESYAIARLPGMKGSFTAPFNGTHGWYWKNTSDQPVLVILSVEGEYTINGLKP